jgi:flavin-dependent dehydrogenase
MVNSLTYQLIIIGAGPSGCAAAIHAAKAGLSVLIVEARVFPRPRPGETLHPGIESLFEELGIMQNVLEGKYSRHRGIYSNSAKGTAFIPYGGTDLEESWKGWLIPREEMDGFLLRRAQDAGARLLHCRGKLRILSMNQLSILVGEEIFQCDYILDGTGHNFWLTRELGKSIKKMSTKRVCYYGACEGEFVPASQSPRFYRKKNSWTWIAQLKPAVCQWTHLDYRGPIRKRNWRPNLLRSLNPIGKTCSRDVTWRIATSPSGPNYFCLGDAAFITDPSSSQGVLKAIMSGMMAAHLVSNVLNKKSLDAEAASTHYTRWIRDWFIHECNHLQKI